MKRHVRDVEHIAQWVFFHFPASVSGLSGERRVYLNSILFPCPEVFKNRGLREIQKFNLNELNNCNVSVAHTETPLSYCFIMVIKANLVIYSAQLLKKVSLKSLFVKMPKKKDANVNE